MGTASFFKILSNYSGTIKLIEIVELAQIEIPYPLKPASNIFNCIDFRRIRWLTGIKDRSIWINRKYRIDNRRKLWKKFLIKKILNILEHILYVYTFKGLFKTLTVPAKGIVIIFVISGNPFLKIEQFQLRFPRCLLITFLTCFTVNWNAIGGENCPEKRFLHKLYEDMVKTKANKQKNICNKN